MNVFIFPTDDRSGQLSIIYHYRLLGHNVFLPKHGTLGLEWSKIATWPMLLCRNSDGKKNFDIHGFDRTQDDLFGEDYFLTQQTVESNVDLICDIVDLTQQKYDIDIYHTLRGGERHLSKYAQIAREHFPSAKWVSSTLNAWDISPGGVMAPNIAKIIPASYENAKTSSNSCTVMCHEIELNLLGVTPRHRRHGFASFNHNFEIRQPKDYRLFVEMNQLLNEHSMSVTNYGGNIRSMGADIRYHKNGPTGNFPTLSPKDCLAFISTLKAIVHFKQTDWGGGCFFHALNTGTPMITTESYVQQSCSQKYLIDGFNCVLVNTPQDAVTAVLKIENDHEFAESLRHGMLEMKRRIFNEQYWKNWSDFLDRLA